MRITLFSYLCTGQKPNGHGYTKNYSPLSDSKLYTCPSGTECRHQHFKNNQQLACTRPQPGAVRKRHHLAGRHSYCMGIYALIKKDRPMLKDAVYLGTSVIEAVGITYAAKHIIGRERPFVKYPDKIHAYGAPDADSPSFPSGHTAAAFSLATSLSITYPKWYVIAPSAVWACGVGFARMNQGVHYPSDVVAGAAIGIGCAFANVYVNRWLNKVLFGE